MKNQSSSYQLSEISPEVIARINVEHQEKIIEATGRPLDPVKGFELIREVTKGFKEDNHEAKEADELFLQLLRKNGLAKPDSENNQSTKEKIKNSPGLLLREQERKRKLQLLALSLNLN